MASGSIAAEMKINYNFLFIFLSECFDEITKMFFFFFNFNLFIRSVEAGCVGDQVCWFLRLLLNIQLVYYYQQLILLIYVNTLWNFGLLPILSH